MRAINPARIARSLVSILLLTLVQTLVAPISINSALAYTQGTVTNGTAYGGTGGGPNGANQNCTNGAIVAIGATKVGQNLGTFMFVCKTINNDASLSSTEATTNVLGTPSESDRCAVGQIGIGIRAIASNGGTLIGGVGLICGNPMSQGNPNTRSIMPDALSSGTVYTFTCPTGQLLAGFYLRTGSLVDQITPKCSTFSNFNYAAVGAPTTTVTGNAALVSFAPVTGSIADTPLTYTVSAVPNSGATITVTGSTSPISVPGLVTRANYTVTVTASNAYGSAPSTGSALASVAIPGGDTDTAMSFNGTSQYLRAPDANSLDISDSITIQAWVYQTASIGAGWNMVVNKEYSYEIGTIAGTWWYALHGQGGSWSGVDTKIPSKLNEWQHIAFTRAAGTAEVNFYLNGTLVFTGSADGAGTGLINNSSYTLTVSGRDGGNGSSSAFFQGHIDELRIYASNRSQQQIAADMNTYGPINTSSLRLYYDFNEGSGATVYNRVSGALAESDLTRYNSPSWDASRIMDSITLGPYSVRVFDRSYLSASGGWRAPSGITRVSALVVAGGGGGGSRHGGGGGAGGLAYGATYPIESSNVYSVVVGVGGIGYGQPGNAPYKSGTDFVTSRLGPGGGVGTVGKNSFLRLASSSTESITALGGGAGSGTGATGAGGSGGGSNQSVTAGSATQYSGTNWIGYGNPGGQGSSGSCSSDWCGGGGGGAGATGGIGNASSSASGGVGGIGRAFALESTTAIFYAGGGGGGSRNGTSIAAGGAGGGGAGGRASEGISAGFATGGGGGGGGFDGSVDYRGGNGGSGVVIVRWITASKPAFTPPTIAYLNAGMTETFTTNVALDSSTVLLTRTFRWESSTTGVNGTYSVIKQGTGAENAFFSWVPMDTATSGSTFAYRVVVTDSDTAGLFIVETSTPVWAIINRALNVAGSSSFGKAINLARSETYTITFGTSTYRPTLSPVIPGITLDTSTAGLAIIRISETMTVGTYYETLTVTDSVSAVVTIPLTIRVASPPSLLNTSEIVENDLIYHLDAGNSQSLILGDTAVATSATWRDLSGNGKHAQTSGTFDTGGFAKTCTAPTWSPNNGGSLAFNGSSTCYWSPYIGNQLDLNVSVEAWVRLDGATLNSASVIVQQNYNPAAASNISYILGDTDQIGSVKFGLWDGGAYRQSGGVTLTQGVWTHLVGTYDGTNFRIYRDGSLINTSANYTAGLGSTINTSGTLIGRRGSSSGSPFFNGSIATVRIYDIALTLAQIQQNYNATKERFLSANTSMLRPFQKYGQSQRETFTITSGFGTRTATLTTGNRTGIAWDTSTANNIILAIQESLTVGTYLDTITVTDTLNQSSFLPLRVSIAKADTITVTVRNPKTLVYTGMPAASLPDISIVGLVSTDTATATRVYSAPASGVGATDTYTALIRSSVVPTDVETYTVTGDTLTSLTVGSLSNYEGVIYETSTLTITQARQPALLVNLFGAIAGSPFTVRSYGGAGSGAFTETVTAGSTAANCSITGRVLSNTSPSNETRTCVILLTRAASRNYFVETATATIYFFAFVINQPSQVGSGPNIGLNGATAITLDPNQAPTISGLSTTNLSLSAGGNFTITGAGFGLTPITVKFWRNKEILVSSTNGTSLVIPISSISALNPTTGKVLVITTNGTAVSVDTLTIAP